jgi:hypothetical protein
MSHIAEELDRCLLQLDATTARRVEALVRDALALAGGPAPDQPMTGKWPDCYFDRTAGALAGEDLKRPAQGEMESRERW